MNAEEIAALIKTILPTIISDLNGGPSATGNTPNANAQQPPTEEENRRTDPAPHLPVECDLFGASKTTTSDNLKKVKKLVQEANLNAFPNYKRFKEASSRKVPEAERKRINDLKEVYKLIKPLAKATQLATQQNIDQNELFAVLCHSLQDLIRFLTTEILTAALCQEYSLDPKKHATSVRRILDSDDSQEKKEDRVFRLHESLAREKHTQVLEASLKRPGSQGAPREPYNPNRKPDHRGQSQHPRFNPKQKAAPNGEAAAKDV